jgi:hypothetical protein
MTEKERAQLKIRDAVSEIGFKPSGAMKNVIDSMNLANAMKMRDDAVYRLNDTGDGCDALSVKMWEAICAGIVNYNEERQREGV